MSKEYIVSTGTGTNLGFEEEIINPFAKALNDYELKNPMMDLKIGQQLDGVLTLKNNKYSLVNIYGKADVVIDNNNFEKLYLNNLNIGDAVEFIITDIIDKNQFIINGSIHSLKIQAVHDFLENAYVSNTIITGVPRELNYAGYTVDVIINDTNISLFMPHLLTDVNKLPDPESIIDTEVDFLLEQVKKEGNNTYIASRKAHLLTMAKNEIKNINKGEVYSGFITGTKDFGVFVQFNDCLTGMIHKSNLTTHAQELLDNNEILPGTSIEFYVKDILQSKKGSKLYLTQTLKDSLWDEIQIDQELVGTVSSIKDFGILVNLDYETKGLLHKSVLVDHMNKYKKGDTVNVIVTNVNKNNRQITLALK